MTKHMRAALASCLAAAALCSVPAPGARAADEPAWTKMDYADSRHPSATDQKRLDATWHDQVEGAYFTRYFFSSLRLSDGREAFVSIAQTPDLCDPAANEAGDTDSAPVCPVIAQVRNPDGTSQVAKGRSCASGALPEEGPEAEAENETDVRATPTGIEFRAKVSGAYPKDCAVSLSIAPAP